MVVPLSRLRRIPVRLFCHLTLALTASVTLAAPPKPWEGTDRPTPYTVVNTHTGVPTTILHLTGWKARGLDIDFTLYHNPGASNAVAYLGSGWSSTFSAYLTGTENGWTLTEGTGLEKAFTSTDGANFAEDAGFYDILHPSRDPDYLEGATIQYDVVRHNGTRYVFSDYEGSGGGLNRVTPAGGDDGTDAMGGGAVLDSSWTNDKVGTVLRLRRIIDRNGNTITLNYYGDSGLGMLTSVADATGRWLSFSGVTGGMRVSDPTGQTWTLTHDSNNCVTTIVNAPATTSPATQPSSRTFSFTYSRVTGGDWRVATLKDWKTNAEDGQHTGQATYTYTYSTSAANQLTLVDGPAWMSDATRPRRKYTYVTSGSSSPATIIEVKTGVDNQTPPQPVSTTTEHDYFANETPTDTLSAIVEKDTSGANSSTRYSWSNYLLTEVLDVQGVDTLLTYNTGTNDVTAAEQKYGSYDQTMTILYDDPSNPHLPTSKTDYAGKSTVYKYNAAGRLTDVWDANHPTSDTSPDLSVQHTHYNVAATGLVSDVSNFSVSGSMPKNWHYTYDSNGNLNGIKRPGESASSTTMGYDTLSRRTWSKRYAGETQTNYSYDGYGRFKNIYYNGSGTPSISYGYDVGGALTSMSDASGSTSWSVDALERPLCESKGGQSISWTYAADGARATTTNWNGDVMTYDRYANGQLHDVKGPWGSQTTDMVSFVYACSCGELSYVDMPYMQHVNQVASGGSNGWQYVSKIDSSVMYDEYAPPPADDLGAVPEITTAGPDAYTRDQTFDSVGLQYPFDPLYRNISEGMTGDSADNYGYTYTLDDVGNRTEENAGWTYLYFDVDTIGQNQLYDIWNYDTIYDEFYYDQSNNLEEIMEDYAGSGGIEFDFSYSPANQLTEIDRYGSGSSFVAGVVYDGLGRLVQKTDENGQVFHLFYDGSNLAYETQSGSSNTVSYQWAGSMLLSQKQNTATSSHTYWYLEDGLGNVVGLVDDANSLVAHYVYDAFGNLRPSTSDTLAIPNPLRYRGMQGYQYLYGIVGTATNTQHTFYNAGARTYDAGTGRWLQEDPIDGNTGDPMSFNRYLYCDASPVDNIDPSGLLRYRYGRPCDSTKDMPGWFPSVAEGTGVVIGFFGGLLGGVLWVGGTEVIGWAGLIKMGLPAAFGGWLGPKAGESWSGSIWCFGQDGNDGVGRLIDEQLKAGLTYSGYGTA